MDDLLLNDLGQTGMFSANLQFLRKSKNLSQEGLAEKLGVSRQSVSKWESGLAFPEMGTLISICDMFNIDMDTLMRGSAESTCAADSASYDKHMNSFARGICTGVALAMLGICAYLAFEGVRLYNSWPSQTNTFGVVLFMLFVLAAVVFFIVHGLLHETFLKKNKALVPSYSAAQTDAFNRKFIWLIAAPVAVLIGDVIAFLLISSMIDLARLGVSYDLWTLSVFMLIAGAAVCVLTWAGIQKSKFEQDKANSDELPPKAQRALTAINSVIFISAIAAYVIMGIIEQTWGTFWWIFILAAFLCGIASAVISALFGKNIDKG